MSSPKCWVCGERTSHQFQATVEHFRPIDWPQRHYVLGNFRAFGFWSGLRANITLLFPFMNTLLHWKYRKMRLEVEEAQTSVEGAGNDLV